MKIAKLIEAFKASSDQDYHPRTFKDELNRQCNSITIPTSFLALLSWPMYIALDIDLFPDLDIIIYLRWGLTLVGFISLVLFLTPAFRKQGYWLIVSIMFYLGLATAIILGLVGGHPSYMGGFAIVIITCSLAPLQRVHSLFHILCTLTFFKITSSLWEVKFLLSDEMYGLFNLVLSVGIAILAIYVFDGIRERNYEKSRLLKIANEDLQKADELKNQMLKLAAHDLKDPLQVIIGYTDLLQMKLRGNKFAAEKLRIIYRSTERMIKLIAGFLDITNIESGKLVMHREEVNFSEVVDASIRQHQKNSEKKNQTLDVEINGACAIDGDKMMLRQVANHLIDNAIKFSPPGKSIWISLDCQDGIVSFNVRDEGPGLNEGEVKRLFEKFQRLGPKPTGGEISTGLGLAITRDLVELHHGSIAVDSQPGKGSSFLVEFPMFDTGCKNS
jgi:signal transduction histidine kinase